MKHIVTVLRICTQSVVLTVEGEDKWEAIENALKQVTQDMEVDWSEIPNEDDRCEAIYYKEIKD
jgi:6-phosphogluconolactonase/glucosamine-6-phosphate isomerase/deaminase